MNQFVWRKSIERLFCILSDTWHFLGDNYLPPPPINYTLTTSTATATGFVAVHCDCYHLAHVCSITVQCAQVYIQTISVN